MDYDVKDYFGSSREIQLMVWVEQARLLETPSYTDALAHADALPDVPDEDPYAALGCDGIDAYSGADSVLDGSHDHALMLVGFAMMENDDVVD